MSCLYMVGRRTLLELRDRGFTYILIALSFHVSVSFYF